MTRLACALAFLLLISASFASGEAPQLASSLSASIDAHGTVTAIGGGMSGLAMNISVPSSTPYQAVETGERMLFDPDGNGYISISVQNPPNPFTYSRKLIAKSVARTTASLPESYTVPSSYNAFRAPTSRTQSGDAGIRALAENITAGAQTPFEKVALLAIYVNRNMKYDSSMVGQEKDALWVSKNMVGVCTEYATLFAALARSMGIPVRYVSGYVYSDQFHEWMGHAWAEAYIGEWVPVDPTWFEVGALDAMHIEESRADEFSSRDTLFASVSHEGVQLEWDTGEKSGAVAGNIETLQASYSEPGTGFDLSAAETRLPLGGSTIVYLSMEGTDYRVIPVSLAGCTGGKTVELDQGERYLVLEPNRTSTLVWEISASPGLQSNYIYTCPLTLNSPYLEKRSISIRVDPSASELPMFEASLRKSNTLAGAENSVFVRLPQQRRGNSFVVVLPDGVYTKLADKASSEIPFSTSSTGAVPVYVGGEGGGFARLSYNAGTSSPSISIDSFSLPQILVAGKEAIVSANISASQYPSDVSLDFEFGGQSSRMERRLPAPASLEFPFTPNSSGTYSVRLSATGGGSRVEESLVSTVLLQPVLTIDSVQNIYSNGTLYTLVSFTAIGSPASPKASIAGSTYPAGSPLTLALPLGKQKLRLSWSDAAGNAYSTDSEITVAQPSVLDVAAPQQGCPLATAFILAVLVFAASPAGAGKSKVQQWK